ncbi:hypothetical protein A9F08_22315 [Klebsiella pneumoniae]|uniref:Uncharacterized protein n=2 Tax=Klebsiella/Raoultella group TaxID=2890311 RepID=A0AAW3FZF1_KLEPN|nr:hypothetical protein CRT62_06755 [Raoultella planticola]AUN57044.1 hypothetical protein C0076_12480 [Klebsiella pneumoniae]AXO73566.1 hypothetical protein BC497_27540 [Klebsiella variicola]PIK83369.1 hypothetical protein CFY86_15235 [Raoultella ornithinolytica]ROD93960.1 hypothetical protein C4Z04_002970 [Klebsiella pneumoniae subsp. pneumoniae]
MIVRKSSILFPLVTKMLRATTKQSLWTDMMITLVAWFQMLAHLKRGLASMRNMKTIIMPALIAVQIVKI